MVFILSDAIRREELMDVKSAVQSLTEKVEFLGKKPAAEIEGD